MKGNDAFRRSQREADAVSRAKAEQIMREYPVARAWYDAVVANCMREKAKRQERGVTATDPHTMDLIARTHIMEKVELRMRIAELEALLRGRDDFIVSEGLWQKFVGQLPK